MRIDRSRRTLRALAVVAAAAAALAACSSQGGAQNQAPAAGGGGGGNPGGQTYVIQPGHDAWVVGHESIVGFEFQSQTAEEYARG